MRRTSAPVLQVALLKFHDSFHDYKMKIACCKELTVVYYYSEVVEVQKQMIEYKEKEAYFVPSLQRVMEKKKRTHVVCETIRFKTICGPL